MNLKRIDTTLLVEDRLAFWSCSGLLMENTYCKEFRLTSELAVKLTRLHYP